MLERLPVLIRKMKVLLWSLIGLSFVLGSSVVFHESGHFLMAKTHDLEIKRFSIGFGAVLFRTTVAQTEFAFSAVPLGGYVDLADPPEKAGSTAQKFYRTAPRIVKSFVILAGPIASLLLAALALLWSETLQAHHRLAVSRVIFQVTPGSVADLAGLRPGDQLTEIAGCQLQPEADIQKVFLKILREKPADISVTVLRDTVQQQTVLHVTYAESIVQLGFAFQSTEVVVPISMRSRFFFESFWNATKKFAELTILTVSALWLLVRLDKKLWSSVNGLLGMAFMSEGLLAANFRQILFFFGLLNLNLGIFNLLPLPPFDGGQLLLVGLSSVVPSPALKSAEVFLTLIGVIGMLLLFGITIYNDLRNRKSFSSGAVLQQVYEVSHGTLARL